MDGRVKKTKNLLTRDWRSLKTACVYLMFSLYLLYFLTWAVNILVPIPTSVIFVHRWNQTNILIYTYRFENVFLLNFLCNNKDKQTAAVSKGKQHPVSVTVLPCSPPSHTKVTLNLIKTVSRLERNSSKFVSVGNHKASTLCKVREFGSMKVIL